MASRYYSAVAQDTTIVGAITSTQTSVVVGGVTGFPMSYPFILALDYNASSEELVQVTAASGTTLTIVRGFNGTSAQAHGTGAVVRHVITAQDMTDAQNHFSASSGIHGVTGSVVGTTDTQTLTNKTLSSAVITTPKTTININAQIGTSYTPVASDQDTWITLSNTNPITLTLPSSVFTAGQGFAIQAINTGQVTIAGASGVTFTSIGTHLRTQYSTAFVLCTGANTYTIGGDLI
jgi:hypothetical protein